MYPKGSRDISQRTSRPRKRKFHGNQHSKNESDNLDTSISANKLNTASNDNIIVNPLHCYRIIEFLTVFGALAEIVICKVCRQNVKFEECGHRGLGFKIVVFCGHREIRSGSLINSGYEINRRIIFTMRLLGIGREGINIFCGLMDICQGISLSTYHSIIEHIHAAASLMFKITTKKAVNEEKELNVQQGRPLTDLKVSGDGSWKKRGFTSLYGVATLIGYYSGKVVDLVVKSSYCHACVLWNKKKDTDAYVEWYEQHEETCSANHEGSAGKMEVDAINEMFSSSEEKFGVRYVDYIGDGDSKTYKSILTLNPYGEDCPVKKSECVGHVQKRMGTRLRNIKKKGEAWRQRKIERSRHKKINHLLWFSHKKKYTFCW